MRLKDLQKEYGEIPAKKMFNLINGKPMLKGVPKIIEHKILDKKTKKSGLYKKLYGRP